MMGKRPSKKNESKEFQKIKFKVGKILNRKNTIETKANFKAKTIILKQQFRQQNNVQVSHKNFSWKVK